MSKRPTTGKAFVQQFWCSSLRFRAQFNRGGLDRPSSVAKFHGCNSRKPSLA